jgi:transporter family protein
MWVVYALLAALAGAAVAVLSKAGLRHVGPAAALAAQSVVVAALAWGTLAVRGGVGELASLDRRTWAILLAAGAVSGASYFLLFLALRSGDAARVVPLDRLSLVFAVLLAALFLGERISTQVALGAALMATGALVIALAGR